MKVKLITPDMVGCPSCGAGKGMLCVVMLVPEVNPLSVRWYHKSREEAVA